MKGLLAVVLLLGSSSSYPEDDKPVMLELAGTCQHTDRFAFQLTRLMDFSSTSSINCSGAKTDWQTSIVFFKNSEAKDPILIFTGKPGPDKYSLEITGMAQFGLDPQAATGRCQMFRPDDSAGKREIACFVEANDGLGERMANLVKFTVDDEVLASGKIKTFSGKCSPSEVSEIVLYEAIASVYHGYQPIEFWPTPACDGATFKSGSSIAFTSQLDPSEKLIFSGNPEDDDPSRMVVKTIEIGNQAPKKAIVGSCGGIREMDGSLYTLCSAAFEEPGSIKAVTVEFPKPLPFED